MVLCSIIFFSRFTIPNSKENWNCWLPLKVVFSSDLVQLSFFLFSRKHYTNRVTRSRRRWRRCTRPRSGSISSSSCASDARPRWGDRRRIWDMFVQQKCRNFANCVYLLTSSHLLRFSSLENRRESARPCGGRGRSRSSRRPSKQCTSLQCLHFRLARISSADTVDNSDSTPYTHAYIVSRSGKNFIIRYSESSTEING